MLSFIKKLVGTKHDKDIKIISPLIGEINAFYEEYENLTDVELHSKTDGLRYFELTDEELAKVLPKIISPATAPCHIAVK